MRYKLLLVGKNQLVKDDFFTRMSDKFECLTVSDREDDTLGHIKYFRPDAYVFCMGKETPEALEGMVQVCGVVAGKQIPIVLIGDRDGTEKFLNMQDDMVNLTLVRPLSASSLKEQITMFLDEQTRLKPVEEPVCEPEPAREEAPAEKAPEVDAAKLFAERVAAEKAAAEKAMLEMAKKNSAEASAQNAEEADDGLKRILVVDDDPLMLRLIKAELKDKYNVATAVSGKIAMNFLSRKSVDMIILDYEMPEEDGAEVLKQIRAQNGLEKIPVVFLTGVKDVTRIQKALALKPQGYLLKPIEHEKLMAAIKQLIG